MKQSNKEKRHQKALKYALEMLAQDKYKNTIDAIYLYGSCARGNYSYKSDVDLLIQYNENFDADLGREMMSVVDSGDYTLPEVELKFMKSSRWKEKEDQFSKNLRKDGVLIWERK